MRGIFTPPATVQIHHAAVWTLIHDRKPDLAAVTRSVLANGGGLDLIPELAVFADELQAVGDPLGLVIATEIADKRESDETDSYTRSLAAMVHVAALAHDVSLDLGWIIAGHRRGTEIADRVAAAKTRSEARAGWIYAGESEILRTIDANEWHRTNTETTGSTTGGYSVRLTLVSDPVTVVTLAGGQIGDVIGCDVEVRNGKLHRLELSTRAG
jgi:hypothetical protein